MFLFDTDHISVLQWQAQPETGRILLRMAPYAPADFFFSIISFHEQTLGANAFINRARTQQALAEGYRLMEKVRSAYAAAQVLPFDAAAVAEFDNLRAQRVRIPTMDLRIASIALTRQLTLLTRNLQDFRQVPGLRVDDWTA